MVIAERVYRENLVIQQKIHFGRQLVFRFKNQYGLSIIEDAAGVGPKYNMAVIRFEIGDHEYDTDFETGITNKEVISDNDEVVLHLLGLIETLPKAKTISYH